jgi:hypothetical protein
MSARFFAGGDEPDTSSSMQIRGFHLAVLSDRSKREEPLSGTDVRRMNSTAGRCPSRDTDPVLSTRSSQGGRPAHGLSV